jgi:drug/metabolite transporter (DMT)-like permease
MREILKRNPRRPHLVLRRRVVTGLILVLIADAIGSVLMYIFEKGEPDGQINAFTDALFFATVQLLTISSQMPNPVTGPGRIVDVVLELYGLFVVTAFAGAFASFFLHVGAEKVDGN